MKCSFCGHKFNEKEAKKACKGCPVSPTCRKVACPKCGYEMPLEPVLFKALRALKGKKDGS